jgi:hypothetical protein
MCRQACPSCFHLSSHPHDGVRRSSLCAAKADGRTALEAEAYSSWMAAMVLFEQEADWEGALNKFLRTRTVYQELAQLGDMEQQVSLGTNPPSRYVTLFPLPACNPCPRRGPHMPTLSGVRAMEVCALTHLDITRRGNE